MAPQEVWCLSKNRFLDEKLAAFCRTKTCGTVLEPKVSRCVTFSSYLFKIKRYEVIYGGAPWNFFSSNKTYFSVKFKIGTAVASVLFFYFSKIEKKHWFFKIFLKLGLWNKSTSYANYLGWGKKRPTSCGYRWNRVGRYFRVMSKFRRITCIHQEHHFWKLNKKWKSSILMCLLCAGDVPGVCTYLRVTCLVCVHIIGCLARKYGPRRFQRRVARLYATKTRFCGSSLSWSIS